MAFNLLCIVIFYIWASLNLHLKSKYNEKDTLKPIMKYREAFKISKDFKIASGECFLGIRR
jgi:hypothetical protein